MKKILYLTVFLFIICTACKKEIDNVEQSRIYCRENMKFNCSGMYTRTFFSGKVGGADFCVSDSIDYYFMLNEVKGEATTPPGVTQLAPGTPPNSTFYRLGICPPTKYKINGLAADFAPYVFISTPYTKGATYLKASEYIEKYYKVGDLKLRDKSTDSFSGFNFEISWGTVLLPNYQYYQSINPYVIPSVGEVLTPSKGKQDNAVFKITEFKKTVYADRITYDVTFEISCKLYYFNVTEGDNYFGELENGKYTTQITIPIGG